MKVILSHWKLAWRSFKKAVKVTFSTTYRQFVLSKQLERFSVDLEKKRKEINEKIDEVLCE